MATKSVRVKAWPYRPQVLAFNSVERYCGICFPLHSRVQGGRSFILYLLPVVLFSIAFNLPKFLEISPELGIDWEFSHNVLYNKIYKQYIELLVTVVLPWMILVYLNFRIYLTVTDKSLRWEIAALISYQSTSSSLKVRICVWVGVSQWNLTVLLKMV